jgi:hypothetical protein
VNEDKSIAKYTLNGKSDNYTFSFHFIEFHISNPSFMDGLETSRTGLHVISIGMQHFSCGTDISCDFVKKK